MRIAIAGQTYHTKTNGQGVFTVQLAEELARIGHQVMVITPSDRRRAYRSVANGVDLCAVMSISLAPFYANVYVTPRPSAEVSRLLDEFQPEVVHVQDHYPLCRSVTQEARRRRLALIGTNHFLPENMAPYVPASRFCRPLVDRLLWAMVLSVLGQMTMVTTPTETAAAILRRQKLRVRVHAISNGVDLGRFFPEAGIDRSEVRRRFGLDPQRILLLYVGRLDREKRVDVLLRAFPRVKYQNFQLAIAGRGKEARALVTLSERLGLGDRVVFLGYVPDADLPALLNSIDLFAMPSEAELQSIATLEAMACGRPVLAADARALPELVHHGRNGLLFRPGDHEDAARCITRLVTEWERWPAMSEASRSLARRHALEGTVRQYEEIYQQCQRGIVPRSPVLFAHRGA